MADDARVTDLEVRIAFLERRVDDLDAVLTQYATVTDALTRRLAHLEAQALGDQEPLEP